MANKTYFAGLDVGSTTIKAVVLDEAGKVLFQEYKRHNTLQADRLRDLLTQIRGKFDGTVRFFMTGSGGSVLAPVIGAPFVQEVTALMYAVEKLHPGIGSIVELGGQGSKAIIWKKDKAGNTRTVFSMNDRCAGGTGSMIDKILAKIGLPHEEARKVHYDKDNLHLIAARCSVYAETDVVGLLKQGVSLNEIFNSLVNAVAKQNLEVLVRGNVLRDKVLLLGGPNRFFPALVESWRDHLVRTWEERKYTPADKPIEELVLSPENGEYFAAMGTVFYGMQEIIGNAEAEKKAFTKDTDRMMADLEDYIAIGSKKQMVDSGKSRPGLVQSEEEKQQFLKEYQNPPFVPPEINTPVVKAYLGVDGGSTSTKAVLLDEDGEMLATDYMLSEGNPLADAKKIFKNLMDQIAAKGAKLEIIGAGSTGYAAKILEDAFSMDAAIVETIAHMQSSLKYYGNVDIICDVGGQDIKIIFLKNGIIKDFRLNTQCSAGNGYFLHVMAEQFGIPVQQFADHAFQARTIPVFNYGCAVFMEQDKVNFQQSGWSKEEMMAGLAAVLPLNIWQYIVQEPNIAKWGRRIVLQGGTQRNMAAVKAQVDYLKDKVEDAEVFVHKFAGESGAIGAALEAKRLVGSKGSTSFIGLEEAVDIKYSVRNDNTTICEFCNNKCRRTFVDTTTPSGKTTRFISGYACEKGSVENKEEMKVIAGESSRIMKSTPNLITETAQELFRDYESAPLPPEGTEWTREVYRQKRKLFGGTKVVHMQESGPFKRSSQADADWRAGLTVAIPKALNIYATAPFFTAFFKSLGIGKIVYSRFTSESLWNKGNKWGSIDPCFPAKVANAHVYDLLKRDEVNAICFPIITHLKSHVTDVLAHMACVIQMGTPEVSYAAFTREKDHFQAAGKEYWKPVINMERENEAADNLFEYFRYRLRVSRDEVHFACQEGYRALDEFYTGMQNRGKEVLTDAIVNNKMVILMLGHPYHNDPGLNHKILDEFQKQGIPIINADSLPLETDFLRPMFSKDKKNGSKKPHLSIKDVWLRSFNRNTNLSIWAAKVAARCPNIATIHFSNFKCGHDVPTYGYIENITESAKSPHFLFHDLDQSKPSSSIFLRIATITYYLDRKKQELVGQDNHHAEILKGTREHAETI